MVEISREMTGQLLSASAEELYAAIGEAIVTSEASPASLGGLTRRGPGLPPAVELAALAKRWFQGKRSEIVAAVCANARVRTLSRQHAQGHDLVLAVCGALDAIASAFGGVPIVTVAALVVRLGLQEMCRQVWSGPE